MNLKKILSVAALCAVSTSSYAANWSSTQLHVNNGEHKNPFSLTKSNTTVVSLQHASGYDYGDNFFLLITAMTTVKMAIKIKTFTVSGIQHLAYQKFLAVISHTGQLLM